MNNNKQLDVHNYTMSHYLGIHEACLNLTLLWYCRSCTMTRMCGR